MTSEEAIDALTERMALALGDLPCACGHERKRHDPEDGDCDAPAGGAWGMCPCCTFRTPDPNLTTTEYGAIAARDVVLSARVEEPCGTCYGNPEMGGLSAELLDHLFQPGNFVADRCGYLLSGGDRCGRDESEHGCKTCKGLGKQYGPLLVTVATMQEVGTTGSGYYVENPIPFVERQSPEEGTC